jgi:hypothetical protein
MVTEQNLTATDYDGTTISNISQNQYEDPIIVPIAPSGMTQTGDRYPDWKRTFASGSLKFQYPRIQ